MTWISSQKNNKKGRAVTGKPAPHRGHDGVPCGGEDVGVVVTLIVALELPAEILPG